MPSLTALVSISVRPTEAVGTRPASAVVMNSPTVVGRLVSGWRRRPPHPPHQITGPCVPGGIIPMGLGLYRVAQVRLQTHQPGTTPPPGLPTSGEGLVAM